jgi:hypothetical protein
MLAPAAAAEPGGASEPVPQARSVLSNKPKQIAFVFTRFDFTLLVAPDFVKPNHGKTAEFTE